MERNKIVNLCFRENVNSILTCIRSLCGCRLICRLVVARSLCIVRRSCCCRCNRIARLLLCWICWSSCGSTNSHKSFSFRLIFGEKTRKRKKKKNALQTMLSEFFFHVGVQISIESRRHYNGTKFVICKLCEPGHSLIYDELLRRRAIYSIEISFSDSFCANFQSKYIPILCSTMSKSKIIICSHIFAFLHRKIKAHQC